MFWLGTANTPPFQAPAQARCANRAPTCWDNVRPSKVPQDFCHLPKHVARDCALDRPGESRTPRAATLCVSKLPTLCLAFQTELGRQTRQGSWLGIAGTVSVCTRYLRLFMEVTPKPITKVANVDCFFRIRASAFCSSRNTAASITKTEVAVHSWHSCAYCRSSADECDSPVAASQRD